MMEVTTSMILELLYYGIEILAIALDQYAIKPNLMKPFSDRVIIP